MNTISCNHSVAGGRKSVLRISVFTQKVLSKLLYLFNRIKQYVPHDCDNCTAFG